ncbi:MAG: argininosuccinate lyase, partial [Clostridiales bacterium]|nr:argininosuccinate lyase [Clostridiales bacterium]
MAQSKLWAGRFEKELDGGVADFNASISFDRRFYAYDIKGSLAHAEMLAAQGIIPAGDFEQISAGLRGILKDIEENRLSFSDEAEDIHSFIEAELCRRIGDAGKRLHTGRSRNDQVAVDLRLYLRDEIKETRNLITQLLKVLVNIAKAHAGSVMPGYTHLQRAQPVTFGHYLMAYCQMFLRDLGRLDDAGRRMNECPLGSGA